MVVFIGRTALRKMILSDFHLGVKGMGRLCSMLQDTLQGAYGAMEKIEAYNLSIFINVD